MAYVPDASTNTRLLFEMIPTGTAPNQFIIKASKPEFSTNASQPPEAAT